MIRIRSVSRSFTRWSRASKCKRYLFFCTIIEIIRVDLSLRRSGFVVARDKLRRRTPSQLLLSGGEPRELARIVNTAARFVIGRRKSCLRRSLVLWWILDRQGVDCDLRMGMKSDGSCLTGHAWVEIDGIPVNDRKDIRDTYDVLEFGGELSVAGSKSESV